MTVLALGPVLGGPAAAQIVPGPGDDAELPDFGDEDAGEDAGEAARDEVVATTQDTTRAATVQLSRTISDRVNRALLALDDAWPAIDESARRGPQFAARNPQVAQDGGSGSGGSGGGFGTLSGWGNASATFLENDGDASPYDGEVLNPTAGVDVTTPGGWVLGLSLGYEGSDIDTDFNDGSLESDGLVVTPYVGTRLGRHAIVDAGLGYARLSYDRERATAGGSVSGSFNADRFFAFSNVTGYAPRRWIDVDNVALTGRLGVRYSAEDQESFLENGLKVDGGTQELGQVSFGGGVRYFPEVTGLRRLELSARADGTVDVIRDSHAAIGSRPEPSDDRTDATLSVGTAATLTQGVTATLTYTNTVSRENLDQMSVSGGLRVTF